MEGNSFVCITGMTTAQVKLTRFAMSMMNIPSYTLGSASTTHPDKVK